jgi:hypothetical protein
MPGPNGEPSGMSAGAWAVTRALQHGHVARNHRCDPDREAIGYINRNPELVSITSFPYMARSF